MTAVIQAEKRQELGSSSAKKIKNLCTGLFVPNRHIWLAQGLLAHKILAATHQIRRALAGAGQCFAIQTVGQPMAFSCHYP